MPRTVQCAHKQTHEVDEENFLINGVLVKVDLSELLDLDLEQFLDRISVDAGFPCLMAQTYEIEAVEDGQTLVLRVRGDVSADLDTTTE